MVAFTVTPCSMPLLEPPLQASVCLAMYVPLFQGSHECDDWLSCLGPRYVSKRIDSLTWEAGLNLPRIGLMSGIIASDQFNTEFPAVRHNLFKPALCWLFSVIDLSTWCQRCACRYRPRYCDLLLWSWLLPGCPFRLFLWRTYGP